MNNLQLVLGGPGCGKTTRLLEIVAREIANGVAPHEIAFVTFTRAAANEAGDRARLQFNLGEKDLPWFRTIHSLAYARLGVQRDEIMGPKDWREFGELVGEILTGHYDSTDSPTEWAGREIGDQLLRIVDYAATTLQPLDVTWRQLNEPVDWWRLKRFADAFALYKEDTGKFDFTDLLMMYIKEGDPIKIKVAVIDEGQDLTAAQWQAVRRAFRDAERVYVGGDDDQAIYHWAGADVAQFLSLTDTPTVLEVSHRLPRAIHKLALSLSKRISRRYTKNFQPSDREGTVEYHQHIHSVDVSAPGTWLLLARNNYMLGGIEAMVRDRGIPYVRRGRPSVTPGDVRVIQMWEKVRMAGSDATLSAAEARALLRDGFGIKTLPQMRELNRYRLADLGVAVHIHLPWYEALVGISERQREFYRTCLRRGEKLTKPPRIRIETIHGVKGAEADNVALVTDMSHKTARSFETSPDTEHRVFYVGSTRAKSALHIIQPQSDLFYPV